MIKWLWRLIWGRCCDHEWEHQNNTYHYYGLEKGENPHAETRHYLCKKCLKRKSIRF